MNTHVKITSLNFGPYDNGYVQIGTLNGALISFNFSTLAIVDFAWLFTEGVAVTEIQYDPTEMIFVGSDEGELVALTFIKEKLEYVYVEMGNRKYCTIEMKKGT